MRVSKATLPPLPYTGWLARCPPLARWGLAMSCAAAGVLVPAGGLAIVAVIAIPIFISTVGLSGMLRDARPLIWHLPLLLVSMLLLRGRVDWPAAAEISTRFMLTAMPIFWLHRVTSSTELVRLFERFLSLRLRLLMLFSLRLWPLLLNDMRDILYLSHIQGAFPDRWRDMRPRHLRRYLNQFLTPMAVRAVRLSDEVANSLEARGLDDL